MWRIWTAGWGPRAWWTWVRTEAIELWVANHLPRRWAYRAFIRVYAADGQAPGPEFVRVCKAWQARVDRVRHVAHPPPDPLLQSEAGAEFAEDHRGVTRDDTPTDRMHVTDRLMQLSLDMAVHLGFKPYGAQAQVIYAVLVDVAQGMPIDPPIFSERPMYTPRYLDDLVKGHGMRRELGVYLDTQVITGDNIGAYRAALSMPFDTVWNAWVREDTAARERKGGDRD